MRGNTRSIRNTHHVRRQLILAASAALAFSAGTASAASNWLGPAGSLNAPTSGLWNVAGNWSPSGVPAGGSSTELDFTDGSSGGYISTNNIASPFNLNLLKINSNNSSIAASNGGALVFTGSNPTIQQTGAGSFAVSAPSTFNNPTTIQQVSGAQLNLSGNLTGSSLAVMNTSGSGNSTVKLTGANTFNGLSVNSNSTVVAGLSGNMTTLGSGSVVLAGGKLALQGQQSAGQAIQQPLSLTGTTTYNPSTHVVTDTHNGFNVATIVDAAQR